MYLYLLQLLRAANSDYITSVTNVAQKKIREARKCIEKVPCKKLETGNNDDGREHRFWSDLRNLCLLPEQAVFGQSKELKEKLEDLRDSSLAVLIVVNVLWLTFMLTVMNQGEKLEVMGSDFASVAFLMIYFVVSTINFYHGNCD